ncbi:MAG TPA: hypothetical protein VF832_16530 [Longimicrobiales bacterium]
MGAALALGATRPAAAQQVRTGIMPDTATIGDVVRAVVRIELPAGWQVAFADSLAVSDTVENAGRRSLDTTAQPGGGTQVTAFFPVTPWRVGDLPIPPVRLHVVGPGVDSLIDARLPSLHVRSVLPADTTKQQPKPPKDVVGPDRLLWPYILAAILALILLALLIWWLVKRLRRRPVVVAPEERLTARERALRDLDRVRVAGLLEAGESKLFYVHSTIAVRRYLDALDPTWGADRTTSELIPRLRKLDLRVAAALARLLDRADLVKFARLRPAQSEALTDWMELRKWVETFPEPQPAEVAEAREEVAA